MRNTCKSFTCVSDPHVKFLHAQITHVKNAHCQMTHVKILHAHVKKKALRYIDSGNPNIHYSVAMQTATSLHF